MKKQYYNNIKEVNTSLKRFKANLNNSVLMFVFALICHNEAHFVQKLKISALQKGIQFINLDI